MKRIKQRGRTKAVSFLFLWDMNFTTSVLLFVLMLGSVAAQAQNQVTATVTNFNNDKGFCRACIFDNSEAFKGSGNALACISTKVSNKQTTLVFTNIPDGTYAISVFHDANGNNKFDTNFFGIPKEGYGASGNNLPFAAAPGFNANKFTLKKNNLSLSIKLRYL